MAVLSLKCPNCGGILEFDDSRQFGFCQFCGNKITIQQDINYIHVNNSLDNQISRLVKQIENSLSIERPNDALTTIEELKKIDPTFPSIPLLSAKSRVMKDIQEKESISLITELMVEEDLNNYFRYTSIRLSIDEICESIGTKQKSLKTDFYNSLKNNNFASAAAILDKKYDQLTESFKKDHFQEYLPTLFEMIIELYEKCVEKLHRIPIEMVKNKYDAEFGRTIITDDETFLNRIKKLKDSFYVYIYSNPTKCVFAEKKTIIGKCFSKIEPKVPYAEIMRDSLLFHFKSYRELPEKINEAISHCYDGFEPYLYPLLSFCLKNNNITPEELDDYESWSIHGYKFSEFYYREEARHAFASILKKTAAYKMPSYYVNSKDALKVVKEYHSIWHEPIEKKGLFGVKTIPHPISDFTIDEINVVSKSSIKATNSKYWRSPFDQYHAVLDFSYPEKPQSNDGIDVNVKKI